MQKAETKRTRQTEVPGDYTAGWLDKLDGRYAFAQEMRGRFDEMAADLGGVDTLSYMQRSLIERALWLEYWLSAQEKDLASGEQLDVGRWVQASNALQGIYGRLGIERRSKQAPSLNDYLAERQS